MRGCTLPRAFGLSGLPLILALLLLAGACSSASAPEETVVAFNAAGPSANAAVTGPEEIAVPFVVCQSSQTWTRPSEEEQAKEIWYGPRYSGTPNRDLVKFGSIFYEDFFTWHGGNSELGDHSRLRGLWSAEDLTAGDPACAEGGRAGREVISVYLLLHEAKEVRLSGDTYRIVVEETASGFQQIQFANLVSPLPPKPAYPTNVSFRAWFRRWARGSALLPESPAEEQQPVPKQQPTDYDLLIVDTSGRELARAGGGLRFEQLTQGSPVPTATQAGVGP